jgi:Rv0078B-related antitoxin
VNGRSLDVVDEMFDLGVEMRRERARREAPELDDAAVDEIVTSWLLSRPGAPIGDSAGTAGRWPRR